MSEEQETDASSTESVNEKQSNPQQELGEKIFDNEDSKSEEPKEAKDEESKESDESSESTEDKTEEADDKKEGEAESDDSKSESDESLEAKALELPEDTMLDGDAKERVVHFANEQKLSKDQAQSLLNEMDQQLIDFRQRSLDARETMVTEWAEAVKTDPELGGDKYNQTIQDAMSAAKRFGSEKFIQILNDEGYGNHPELVRVFARIGTLMREDKLITGGEAIGAKKSHAEIFYPKTKEV